jgi:hypothetical protein
MLLESHMRIPRVLCWLAVSTAGIAAVCVGIACGGGPELPTPPGEAGTLEVHVSAGGPVSGADISVYALVDSTGKVQEGVGNRGVIGTGGPTDADGRATVKFTTQYSGPVQVVASGSAMSYADPTVPSRDGTPGVAIQIGTDFRLSSYLGGYVAGTSGLVVVDLYTTLADHHALAYARGLHPLHPGTRNLSEALAERDPLFVKHVCPPSLWKPEKLRNTLPAALTAGPQALADMGCAAFADIALNWLARDIAGEAGYDPGSTAFNAITLTRLLEQDLDADAMFDGKGDGGAQLLTSGRPPVALDAQTLRVPLANNLDRFVRAPDVNKSSLTRVDLKNAGIYEAIANDGSDLFGEPPSGTFQFERVPPSVAFATPIPAASNTPLEVRVTATDGGAGVSAVYVQLNGGEPVPATATGAAGVYEAGPLTLRFGSNAIVTWAVDSAGTSGQGQPSPATATATITFDDQKPAPDYVGGFASYYDERGLTIGTSDGVAVVPVQYDCSTARNRCDKTTINPNHIYKVATRLGWTTQPTAAVLEGANPGNIPILQWKVPYNSTVDAAITRATYSVAVSCTGCSYPAATGDLWPSATTSSGALLFDLPVAENLIPALASLPGAAALAVTITVADAAGNVTTTEPINVPFHLLGPPLAVRDAGFGSWAGAPDVTQYNGGTSNPQPVSYLAMWSAQPLWLRHYVVSNPHQVPVAFSQPSATWTNHESWKHDRRAGSLGSVTSPIWFIRTGCSVNYATCGRSGRVYTAPACAGQGSCSNDPGSSILQGDAPDPSSLKAPWSFSDFYPSGCPQAEPRPDDWGEFTTAIPTGTAAYSNGGAINANAAGRYIVPAAIAGVGAPAIVDLFLLLPAVTRKPAGYPSPTPDRPPYLTSQGAAGMDGIPTSYAVPVHAVFTRTSNRVGCDNGTAEFEYNWYIDYQYLTEVHDDVTGAWSLETAALDGSSRELGELLPESSFDINLRIPHSP